MIKKSILVCFIIFALQTVLSCDICDCPRSRKLEANYTGLTLKAYNTAGFENTLINDTVFVNSFGLKFSLDVNYIEIAGRVEDRPNVGFASALACDCVGDEYIESDKVRKIEILVTNTLTQEETDVTSHFAFFDYATNSHVSLTNQTAWPSALWVDLVVFDDIPKSSVFTVTYFMESGVEFTKETTTINFY
jgi:hypothetical protein